MPNDLSGPAGSAPKWQLRTLSKDRVAIDVCQDGGEVHHAEINVRGCGPMTPETERAFADLVLALVKLDREKKESANA